WDTKNFPNSFSGTTYLQAKIVSGADTVQSKIFPISISNTMVLHNIDGLILSRRGFGTGKVAVVTNGTPPALSRTYRLTFLSTGDSLLCRITDAVTNIDQFGQYKIGYGKSESPTFDNIRIEIENDRIAVAGEHTGWKNPAVLFPMTVDIDNLNPLKTIKTPYDYDISFSSAIVDTSVGASGLYHQIPVRFKVKNIVTNTFLKFLVQDMDNNYLLSRGDTIRILEDYVSLVNFKFAWKMGYGTINGNESEPGDGDIFSIVTTKPFSQSDTIIFSTDKLVSVEDGPVDGPYSFDLAQNYPNPFNPVTTIQFTIPSQQQVKIVVYDILGKEIAVLVNERLSAGGHTVQFNAASLPSGIYFYRLQSQNFVSTKKLLLIK
ncbi:MAG: T9SS type A sorting domain-containing protein, partial [Bacteroidota bacterium]